MTEPHNSLFVNEAKREIELYIPFGSTFVPDGVTFVHHPAISTTHTEWPQSTTQSCLHCEEPFEGVPIPIPRSYDPITGKLEADPGVVCCVPCLRGYFNEHQHFDITLRWAIAKRVLFDVFGLKGPFGCAPPRTALVKHGGPYTAQDFRDCTNKVVVRRASPFLCVMRPTMYKEIPLVIADPSPPSLPTTTTTTILESTTSDTEPALPSPPPPPPPPFLPPTTVAAPPQPSNVANLPPKPPRKRRPTKKEKLVADTTAAATETTTELPTHLMPPPPPAVPATPKKMTVLQRLLFGKNK